MVVLAAADGPLAERFREVARLEIVRSHEAGKLRQRVRAWRRRGIDRAIVNSAATAWMGEALAAEGVPMIGLVHEMAETIRKLRATDALARLSGAAEAMVFPAQLVRQHTERLLGIDIKQPVIMPQGLFRASQFPSVDERQAAKLRLAKAHGFDASATVFLNVGHGDYRKGFDRFVAWADEYKKKDPDAVFIWVGAVDPDFAPQPGAGSNATAQPPNLLMPGFVEDLSDFYSAADLFALSSREDPFPSVVLDALAHRTPVVIIRGCSGIEDLAAEGPVVVLESDKPEEFSGVVRKLLADRETLAKMGVAGQRLIRHSFGFRRYTDDLVRIFSGGREPRYSVVVPSYNYSAFLPDRLRSIFDQTVLPSEILVLDDASTDDSAVVAEDILTQSGVDWRLEVNQVNSGNVFAQWRKAAELAQHDFIWIAEADDVADTDFARQAMAVFSDPDVDLVFCQSRQIDADNQVIRPDYQEYLAEVSATRWQADYVVDGRDELAKAMAVKNTIPNVSAVIFRTKALRRALDAVGADLANWRVAGDWRIYSELLQAGKIGYISAILNSHRLHAHSVTKSAFGLTEFSEIKAMQKLISERTPVSKDVAAAAHAYLGKLVVEHELRERFGDAELAEF